MFTNEIKFFIIKKFADESDFDTLCREMNIHSSYFTGNFGMRITDFIFELEKTTTDPTAKLYKALIKLKPHFKQEIDNLFEHQKVINDCPYQGLYHFREEQSKYFFGRNDYIVKLIKAVEKYSIVSVIGSSGSGKSSLVFAGLFPHLRKNNNRLIIHFRPANNPYNKLISALLSFLEPGMTELERLKEIDKYEKDFKQGKIRLKHIIQRIIELNHKKSLLLYADQFEELFTLTKEFDEQDKFLGQIIDVVKAYSEKKPAFTFLFSLRADFLNKALQHNKFGEYLVNDIKLCPMNREQLKHSIEKPAQIQNVSLDTLLIETIIDEIINKPANLPILEFALTQLWEKQSNGMITLSNFQEIGGIETALTKYAESIFKSFTEEQQLQLPGLFTQLVNPGEGTEDTKRIAQENEIGNSNWNLITKLADKKLVVTKNENGINTVEIIHEALIHRWWRFREWIDKEKKFRIWQEDLRRRIKKWMNKNFNDKVLLSGFELAEANDWYNTVEFDLPKEEEIFIEKSLDKEKKEKKIRKIVFISLISALSIVCIIASIFTTISFMNIKILNKNKANFYYKAGQEAEKEAEFNNASLHYYNSLKYTDLVQCRLDIMGILNKQVYELCKLVGHKGVVTSVCFSSNGNTFVSASFDKSIKLWDAKTGKNIETFTGHKTGINTVCISPDSKLLASTSWDHKIKLWDINTGENINTFKGHESEITSIRFFCDSKTLVSVSWDYTIKLWDVITGENIKTFSQNFQYNAKHYLSPNGEIVISVEANKITLLNTRSEKIIKTFTANEISKYSICSFSSDGKIFVSADLDNIIKLWNINTGKIIQTLIGHGKITANCFSPDGKTIASASDDGIIKLWDVNTGNVTQTLIGHEDEVNSICFSPNSKILLSSSGLTMILWEIQTSGNIKRSTKDRKKTNSFNYHSDNNTIVFLDWDYRSKSYKEIIVTNTSMIAPRKELLRKLEEYKKYFISYNIEGNGYIVFNPRFNLQFLKKKWYKARNGNYLLFENGGKQYTELFKNEYLNTKKFINEIDEDY